MGIDNAHYHGWNGSLRSPWLGCLAIVRVALLQVFRRKAYWLVLALGLLNLMLFWSIIYFITQWDAGGKYKDQILQWLDFSAYPVQGKENGYIEFMWRQSHIVTILLAFSGSLLVGFDFRMSTLPFYLSRRIDRRHYIVGKLLAVSTIIGLITVLPALLLFLEYGMFTSNIEYWLENWRIPISIFGYGLVLCVVMSTLLVTVSAYLQQVAPISVTWCSVFLLLALMATTLRRETDNVYWNLIDPWRDMRYVGRLCFGTIEGSTDERLAWWALLILSVICITALAALAHRVRAVDVVE